MPSSFSLSMEAEAWLIEQPWPENRTAMILPSWIWKSIRRRSPHSGFASSNDTSGCSSVPLFRGCL